MKQTFEIDWSEGKITEELIRCLLFDYFEIITPNRAYQINVKEIEPKEQKHGN